VTFQLATQCLNHYAISYLIEHFCSSFHRLETEDKSPKRACLERRAQDYVKESGLECRLEGTHNVFRASPAISMALSHGPMLVTVGRPALAVSYSSGSCGSLGLGVLAGDPARRVSAMMEKGDVAGSEQWLSGGGKLGSLRQGPSISFTWHMAPTVNLLS
jgi:hypothetical protein